MLQTTDRGMSHAAEVHQQKQHGPLWITGFEDISFCFGKNSFQRTNCQGCRIAGLWHDCASPGIPPFSKWVILLIAFLSQGCLPTQNWNVPTLLYYCNRLSQVIHPEQIKPRFCLGRASHARYLMERTCFFNWAPSLHPCGYDEHFETTPQSLMLNVFRTNWWGVSLILVQIPVSISTWIHACIVSHPTLLFMP